MIRAAVVELLKLILFDFDARDIRNRTDDESLFRESPKIYGLKQIEKIFRVGWFCECFYREALAIRKTTFI